jgi:hypothetical protein
MRERSQIMTAAQVETRLMTLEQEVARLKAQIAGTPANPNQWVEEIAGTFANDPTFEEAMRLGRKWRETERGSKPRTKRRASRGKRNGHA